ncbi:MAG: hypothetical protein KQJ78_21615 [Deltaproteobacteria bacterium]|nr:hypothetical protein [Deltaproteobacteria bacterium]
MRFSGLAARWACLAALAVALLSASASPAAAAVFNVSNEAELVAALAQCETNYEDNVINIAPGTYNLSTFLAFENDVPDRSLTVRGDGGLAVLDGGDANQVAYFYPDGDRFILTFQNLVFQHGGGPDPYPGMGLEVSMYGVDAVVRVEDCQFLDNFSPMFGQGIGTYLESHTVILERCIIARNTFDPTGFTCQGGGAAILSDIDGQVRVADCLFIDNDAGATFCVGGGLMTVVPTDFALVNNTFVNNHAAAVGGLFLIMAPEVYTAPVYNNVIRGNTVDVPSPADVFVEWDEPGIEAKIMFSHNILGEIDGDAPELILQTANQDVDPGLDVNYRPTDTSPCRDTGDNAAPGLTALDLDSLPRIQNGVVDRGAYEYPVGDLGFAPAYLAVTTAPGLNPASQVFQARNLGGAAIDFTLTEDRPWLSLDTAAGHLGPVGSQDVTASFAAASLTPGLYQALVLGRDVTHGTTRLFVVNLNVDAGTQRTMYRLYNPADYQYLFTTDPHEQAALVALGWSDESSPVPFSVASTAISGSRVAHRLYNPWTGVHYLTLNNGERDALVGLGWQAERDQGWMYAGQVAGAAEVYHLYHPDTGGHLYTANPRELAWILANLPPWQQQTSLGWAFRRWPN